MNLQVVTVPPDTVVYPAQFPGGKDSLLHFIDRNFNYRRTGTCSYPSRVEVKFKLDENGNFKQITDLRPAEGAIAVELLRVFQLMPAWKPANYQGKPVPSVQYLQFPVKGE